QFVDASNRPGAWTFERHFQVFFDREVRKNAAAFGNIADTQRGDAKRRPSGRGVAENAHHAVARVREAHEAAQRRALAGAVAAKQSDDLALTHFESDAMQDMTLAVKSMKALGLERDPAHAAAVP